MKKYKSILPEITLKYKKGDAKKIKIQSSDDSYELCKELFNSDTVNFSEEVILIMLNRANNTIGWVRISTGGFSGAVVDPKVIFTYALSVGASALILAHNHPSGNANPSGSDISMTNKLKSGGDILDITFLDHIIYTEDNGYYSFADEGQL